MKYMVRFFLFFFPFFVSAETVFVTIPPYVTIVQSLVGEDVEVKALLDGNTDMHTFDLSFRKGQELSQAAAWVIIGEPFEERFARSLQEKNTRFAVLDLRQCIEPIIEGHGHIHEGHVHGVDPHHWISPKQMILQTDCIAVFLAKRFSFKREQIFRNAAKIKKNLEALDSEVEGILKPVKGKMIIVSHPAFAYLARDYGFLQISIEQEGKEPTAAKLQQLVLVAKEEKLKRLFSVKQHSLSSSSFLAKETKADIVVLDPMQKEYFSMVRAIAKALASVGEQNE